MTDRSGAPIDTAYISIRQHTSADAPEVREARQQNVADRSGAPIDTAYVSIRQHTSADAPEVREARQQTWRIGLALQ